MGGIRLKAEECSAHYKCDVGTVACNVQAGSYIAFDQVHVPPEVTMVRVRVYSETRGAIDIKADSVEGKRMAHIVIQPTGDDYKVVHAPAPV